MNAKRSHDTPSYWGLIVMTAVFITADTPVAERSSPHHTIISSTISLIEKLMTRYQSDGTINRWLTSWWGYKEMVRNLADDNTKKWRKADTSKRHSKYHLVCSLPLSFRHHRVSAWNKHLDVSDLSMESMNMYAGQVVSWRLVYFYTENSLR